MCETSPRPARGSASSRPRWGVLYAVTLPQLTALAVIEASQASHPLRTALRCTAALGVFVAMGVWVHASRAAFDLQNWCDCAGERMTVRMIHSQRPAAAEAFDAPLPAAVPEDEEALV
jgi:threonine dehydrogenase-like Zn-dependent dehydrogenase